MTLWKILPLLAAAVIAGPAGATVSFVQTSATSYTSGGIGRPDTINQGPSPVYTDYASGSYAVSTSDFSDERFLAQVKASTAAAVRLNSLTDVDFLARSSVTIDVLANQLPSHGQASATAIYDFAVDTASSLTFSITTVPVSASNQDYVSFSVFSLDTDGMILDVIRRGVFAGISNGTTYDVPPGIYSVQFNTFADGNVPTITYPGGARASALVGANLSINSPAAVPGVPEPATWAMMISGLGLVGAAMRRRASGAGLQKALSYSTARLP
jgi:hypothetical protein